MSKNSRRFSGTVSSYDTLYCDKYCRDNVYKHDSADNLHIKYDNHDYHNSAISDNQNIDGRDENTYQLNNNRNLSKEQYIDSEKEKKSCFEKFINAEKHLKNKRQFLICSEECVSGGICTQGYRVRHCDDLFRDLEFILKLVAIIILSSAIIIPKYLRYPLTSTNMPRSERNYIRHWYYTPANGAIISLLVLIVLIVVDTERKILTIFFLIVYSVLLFTAAIIVILKIHDWLPKQVMEKPGYPSPAIVQDEKGVFQDYEFYPIPGSPYGLKNVEPNEFSVHSFKNKTKHRRNKLVLRKNKMFLISNDLYKQDNKHNDTTTRVTKPFIRSTTISNANVIVSPKPGTEASINFHFAITKRVYILPTLLIIGALIMLIDMIIFIIEY